MAGRAINLWGRGFLEQWGAQINAPQILETAHKMMFKMGYITGKGIGKIIKDDHRLSISRTKQELAFQILD